MRLLYDENLPPRLVPRLADIYPASVHVRDVGLKNVPDELVWQYAQENGLVIVSKDSDFHHRSLLFGFPPKVIWLRRGNCSVQDIETMLRSHHAEIEAFNKDTEGAFLVLS